MNGNATGKDDNVTASLLLGVDVGTTTAKAVLISTRGTLLGAASRDHPTYSPQPGYYEQDSHAWWAGVCQTIRQILDETQAAPASIVGVSLSGQGCACLPVGRDGRTLVRASIWTDTRAAAQKERLRDTFADDLGTVTGNDLYDQPEPRMMWLREHQPDLYRESAHFLTTVSYLIFRFTGRLVASRADWGFHLAYDRLSHAWNEPFLAEIGLSSQRFPTLQAPLELAGHVTPQAAEQTGLVAGTPVITGGQDSTVAPLAVGVLGAGQSVFTRGTTDLLSCCTDQPGYHPHLYTTCAVLPDRYISLDMRQVTAAGASYKWLAETLYGQATEDRFKQMDDLAAAVRPGAGGLLFLPYLLMSTSAEPAHERGGAFFNLTVTTTPGELCRAVMEGTGYALREAIRRMRGAGIDITDLRVTGGPTRSAVWNEIIADVSQLPVLVPAQHASAAFGAALLAGLGVGIFDSTRDYETLSEIIQLQPPLQPKASLAPIYASMYDVFITLARRSSGISPQLRAAQLADEIDKV
jgi:xylulokinase